MESSPLPLAAGSSRPQGSGALLRRLRAARDRLLASTRFRRWALRFPLTRPIARRRTRALFDLCAGFVYTQVLHACIRLQLFQRIAPGETTTPALLAPQLDLSEEATRRLLAAAASLGLLRRLDDDRYGLGPLGAAIVADPAIAMMVEHHALLYDDLADPVRLLRADGDGASLARYWPYAGASAGASADGALGTPHVTPYSDLMSASQSFIADQVLDAYSLARHRRLLDVGGGDGSFVASCAARAPHLALAVLDLPAVAERARERLEARGLATRISVHDGDFLREPLPRGHDLISLIRIVHDHDDAAAMTLLRSCREALEPGGRLLLAEPMSDTRGAEPVGEAYFGFYLLAMGSGRPRRIDELERMLRAAGFTRVRRLRTHVPLLTRALLAE